MHMDILTKEHSYTGMCVYTHTHAHTHGHTEKHTIKGGKEGRKEV